MKENRSVACSKTVKLINQYIWSSTNPMAHCTHTHANVVLYMNAGGCIMLQSLALSKRVASKRASYCLGDQYKNGLSRTSNLQHWWYRLLLSRFWKPGYLGNVVTQKVISWYQYRSCSSWVQLPPFTRPCSRSLHVRTSSHLASQPTEGQAPLGVRHAPAAWYNFQFVTH